MHKTPPIRLRPSEPTASESVPSVRLSVGPFVCVCLSVLSALLSAAKGNYPQIWNKGWSLPVRGFGDNLTDALDRLLTQDVRISAVHRD